MNYLDLDKAEEKYIYIFFTWRTEKKRVDLFFLVLFGVSLFLVHDVILGFLMKENGKEPST